MCTCIFTVCRGVTILDGARGMKQVGAPMFQPEIFRKQMSSTVGEESIVIFLGLFGAPSSDSAPP